MFEESSQNALYVDRIRGRLKVETIQLTYAGGTGTLDAANSSPGVLAAGAGTITITGLPTAGFSHWFAPVATGAANITGRVTTSSASAGTATIDLSATPANGERLYLTVLLGRTG